MAFTARTRTCSNARNTYTPRTRGLKSSDWAEGDIAFLRHVEYHSKEQRGHVRAGHLGCLSPGAACHPVIILKKGPRTASGEQFYIVTTVSAYSSGAHNDYLAPWDQRHHRYKTKTDFRSFEGSEVYAAGGRPALHLRAGQSFPKPETSWVYAREAGVVPESVLAPFTKARCDLQMTAASHGDLVAHMTLACRHFSSMLADPRIAGPEAVTAAPPARATAMINSAAPKAAITTSPAASAKINAAPATPPVKRTAPATSWASVATTKTEVAKPKRANMVLKSTAVRC